MSTLHLCYRFSDSPQWFYLGPLAEDFAWADLRTTFTEQMAEDETVTLLVEARSMTEEEVANLKEGEP